MLRVVGCLTQDHDLGLIALAGLICLLATSTSVRLLVASGCDPRLRSFVRTGAAILAFSTGVWTMHFIGILAFRPAVPFSLNIPLCILSLVVSIIATTLAFGVRSLGNSSPRITITAGLILAVGISVMHFVGMHALRMPGVIH